MAASVGIVGAGVTGLEIARRLAAAGLETTVFEARDELGGQARAFAFHGQPADCHGHILSPTDEALLAAVAELGLASTLCWSEVTRSYFVGGRVTAFSGLADVFRFRGLSLPAKLRLALAPSRLQRRQLCAERLDQVTGADWLRGRMGESAFELVWRPLLDKLFGGGGGRVSAAWTYGQLLRGAPGSRTGLRPAVAGVLGGGAFSLVRRQTQSFEADGGTIRRGFQVVRVTPIARRKGFLVSGQSGETFRFDRVVAAIPAPQVLRLLDGFPEGWQELLGELQYRRALTVVLSVDEPLSGHLWVNVCDPEVPFLQVIETDQIPGARRPGGFRLVHLPIFADEDDGLWARSDDRLTEEAVTGLGRIFPGIPRQRIIERWVFRESGVLPVHSPGQAARLARRPEEPAGFYLADAGLAFPGPSLNQALLLAARTADTILDLPA